MKKSLALLGLICVAGMAATVSFEAEADAQYRRYGRRYGYRHRPHFYFGGQLGGAVVVNQNTPGYDVGYLGHGGGGGLFVGFRLGPWVSVELNGNVSSHAERWDAATCGGASCIVLDSILLFSGTADLKVHIPTRGPLEPFFQGGVGFAAASVADPTDTRVSNSDGVFAQGFTFAVGGGLDVYLGRWLSLGGRILYRGYGMGEPLFEWAGVGKSRNFASVITADVFLTIHL